MVVLQAYIWGVININSTVFFYLCIIKYQNRSIHIDYLTGLNNRKKLDVYLNEKILLSTESNSFSLIVVDINNFKAINDLHGQTVGDDALEVFAGLLKNCLRTTDFIARYGGDEFVIILSFKSKGSYSKYRE
jgi:diguanylate cyclase (GGDEF)-like protein